MKLHRGILVATALLLGLFGWTEWVRAATLAPSKTQDTRKINIVRQYNIPVVPGQKTVAAIPALMSFWGATNQQVILKSDFTYSIKPDQMQITADDWGMKRRNYELTWEAPTAQTIIVTQKLEVEISYQTTLYTAAQLPYAPEVLTKYANALQKEEEINPENPELTAICAPIISRARWAEEAVELTCDWINDNVTFKHNAAGPSDQTLHTHTANCTGMSCLACAMLRKMGIPCAVVEGKFIGSDSGHAYIEVYYPDAGWVFYDLSNGERGFKGLDCLMTTGWAYRVENAAGSQWHDGHFCLDKDAAPFDHEMKLVKAPLRKLPKQLVAGVRVVHEKTPASVKVRHESIAQLIMDLSIPPGVREYSSSIGCGAGHATGINRLAQKICPAAKSLN